LNDGRGSELERQCKKEMRRRLREGRLVGKWNGKKKEEIFLGKGYKDRGDRKTQ